MEGTISCLKMRKYDFKSSVVAHARVAKPPACLSTHVFFLKKKMG
jgi:hypothetical protein